MNPMTNEMSCEFNLAAHFYLQMVLQKVIKIALTSMELGSRIYTIQTTKEPMISYERDKRYIEDLKRAGGWCEPVENSMRNIPRELLL